MGVGESEGWGSGEAVVDDVCVGRSVGVAVRVAVATRVAVAEGKGTAVGTRAVAELQAVRKPKKDKSKTLQTLINAFTGC